MLAQAGRPGQERRVAEPLGVGAQRQRDAVIGPAVAVPVAALEEPGQGVELRPRSSGGSSVSPPARAAARLASLSNASRR